MNILILGSGGREHAFAWKISQSPKLAQLYVAPGNGGTEKLGKNLAIDPLDFEAVKKAVLDYGIDMVIVGPEAPLVGGIFDFFKADAQLRPVAIIAPSQHGAQLEGSKEYAKKFMQRHNIPTAAYGSFTKETLDEGLKFLDTLSAPYVLKADGLAAGKGVVILDTPEAAKEELKAMLDGEKFGNASQTVVIEEFLDGIELSVFVLTDGKDYIILPEAKDYKRIGEGDTGLNTGGMGCVSPVPFAGKEFLQKVEEQIIVPTINGLAAEQIDYRGFIFLGLMKVGDSPFVIEYNVRMGDPETEVVLPRIKSDLLELLADTASGHLSGKVVETDHRCATAVMLVSGGYPETYEKGKEITLDEGIESIVFHAGTQQTDTGLRTSGGRVIAVTSYGDSLRQALEASYTDVEKINFNQKYFRRDIGKDVL